MPSPVFLSRPGPGFTPLAVARGAQLSVVGGFRALQNPDLPRHGFYRRAARAVAASLVLELLLRAALQFVLGVLWALGAAPETRGAVLWAVDEVLQLRPLLVLALKDSAAMDSLFLDSLRWVDRTNDQKHPGTQRLYGALADLPRVYVGLPGGGGAAAEPAGAADAVPGSMAPGLRTPPALARARGALARVPRRYRNLARRAAWRWARLGAAAALARLPVVGRAVWPALAFYSFRSAVGTSAAVVIFGVGLALPRHWLAVFLAAFWGSQSMMRDLLRPYFVRLPFTPVSRRLWYENRQGILFGFGAALHLLVRLPYIGVLVYGLAAASSAYLVTKVTDPLPPPRELDVWVQEQAVRPALGAELTPSRLTVPAPPGSRPQSRTQSRPPSRPPSSVLDERLAGPLDGARGGTPF